jgi:hypothetical protein
MYVTWIRSFICGLINAFLDFARNDYSGPPMTNILDIIDYVKPTALLGLSTISVSSRLYRASAVHR